MSTSFQGQTDGSEKKDELIMHEGEADQADDRSSVGAQMRDMASRIPEQLSAIGRDISRTIERAISAKDDYMLAVKVSHDAQVRLGQLVQGGGFRTRAGAPAFLIDEGIKYQGPVFESAEQKAGEMQGVRGE